MCVYPCHYYKPRTYVAAYNAYICRLVMHIIISIADTASDEHTYLVCMYSNVGIC